MNDRILFAVAALAGATLCTESALTRLLAVAQHYHFAFLVVSLALLGFAASGTLLSLSDRLRRMSAERILSWCGAAFVLSLIAAYLIINWLPFDSYAIAIDRRQIVYFSLYYLALSLPFLFSGLGIAGALASARDTESGTRSNTIYAANLLGSAGGVLIALGLMALAGVPGALLGSCLLGALPTVIIPGSTTGFDRLKRGFAHLVLIGGILGLLWLGTSNISWRAPIGLVISPYKSLAYARLHPGYQPLLGRWNAISRLDLVEGAGTRALPGLSYTYPGNPPPQLGMSIDGDHLSPVSLVTAEEFEPAGFLPEALAFTLRPGAKTLVIEPGAGLGVLQAQTGGAGAITAVLHNPLVPMAIARSAPESNPFIQPGTQTRISSGREYLQRDAGPYDLITMPLSESYLPVTNGAYSLQETYSLTEEMLSQALSHLTPEGILVVSRWLQTPPSESLRMAATLVEALEANNVTDPRQALVAYRGIQTITFLVQPSGWENEELVRVREFAGERRYDLVWTPDIKLEDVNRHNLLPTPDYYKTFQALLEAPDLGAFYEAYPYDIRPATDNHPFFYHFFTWEQVPEIMAGLGRTWQPFGGSGFLILLALLFLVSLLSAVLVLAPLALQPFMRRLASQRGDVYALEIEGFSPGKRQARRRQLWRVLLYFSLIGLAFLMVEIPLIQRWILLLGHPAYAFSAVVLALLLFSGLGSAVADKPWLPKRAAMGLLALLSLLTPWITTMVIQQTLGWPVLARTAAAMLALLPLGFLMGLPFPFGLQQIERRLHGWVPWAWAVNGSASVVAAVLAAILSLTFGFNLVLLLGALAYTCAILVYINWRKA